jgi:hypothetical protein
VRLPVAKAINVQHGPAGHQLSIWAILSADVHQTLHATRTPWPGEDCRQSCIGLGVRSTDKEDLQKHTLLIQGEHSLHDENRRSRQGARWIFQSDFNRAADCEANLPHKVRIRG